MTKHNEHTQSDGADCRADFAFVMSCYDTWPTYAELWIKDRKEAA